MVKGLDVFLEYFRDYTDQYVLIGGAACSVSYEEQGISFGRITKDLDMESFLEEFTVTANELKSLRIRGTSPDSIKKRLIEIYLNND